MLAPASATPGLSQWTVDPAVVIILLLAFLYWLGSRRTITPERTRRTQTVRASCFYLALLILLLALASPIDTISQQLFWVHMVQHVMLIMIAAPLIVLARPWIRVWRALPLGSRRSLAHSLGQGGRLSPLARLSGFLGRPAPSFVVFSVVLLGWHLPFMFDSTLHSSALHALEHTLFFGTALMFWKQVIPSAPLHISLAPAERVVYLIGAMIVSWALAVVLALSTHPLYSYYTHLPGRPGGISAITDQQLASGIMWVPGSVTFVIVMFVYIHRWLMPPAPAASGAPRLAGEH